MTVEITKNNLRNPYWRLNSGLYHIIDKEGHDVPFQFNYVQKRLWEDLWYNNAIDKARQHGTTTFCCLFMLDACLWNSNTEAGVIAHTRTDAQEIFRRKFQYPYDSLPPEIRKKKPLNTDSKSQMSWANHSVVNVATSMRSSTLNYLLVSELGKIAKKYPEKAREIMTGALEAVGTGGENMIFVESTAEGRSGVFFELCDRAEKLQLAKKKLTHMDYRLHFFPWFECPDYVLYEPVGISKEMVKYFEEVEAATGVKLSQAQKAWYVKKHEVLGEDILREYPSTLEESFRAGTLGTYFKTQFIKIRQEGRICKVPVQDGIVVDTWWDLGMNDEMAIWFTQDVGREIHMLNYHESNGEGLEYYRDLLDDWAKAYGYRYGRHVAPHDIKVRELGSGVSRFETAHKLGIPFEIAPRVEKKMDSIQKARSMLNICWFDEENCDLGIERLENYRKQWDDIHGVYRDKPLHDINSNGSDAYQTMAIAHDFRRPGGGRPRARKRRVRTVASKGWT